MNKKKLTPSNNALITENMNELKITVDNIRSIFSKSEDIIYQDILVNGLVKLTLIYVDGLVDHTYLSDYVLKPLQNPTLVEDIYSEKSLIKKIKEGFIYFSSINSAKDMNDVVKNMLMGSAILIFNKKNHATLLDVKGFDKRSVDTPTEEKSLRGSKDCFVETLISNTALIRRKIKSPDIVIEILTIGSVSNTLVSLIYLDGVASEKLVNKVRTKLKKIKVDHVLFTNLIEENIIGQKHTTFPQIDYTEKPDYFCAGLFEGRVGILIDGIPFSILAPTSIVNFFQTTDDYSTNYIIATTIRLLRYFLTIVALFLPAIYIALTEFHHEMIPEALALTIIESEQGVPFPIFIETLFLTFAFQALVEAGVRIWSSIGGMVSIVGALIVGEAAITAGIVSPGVVVVVATSSIAAYSIPNRDFSLSIWFWSLLLILLSSIIGLFGVTLGALMLLYHLVQIESFELPYLSPFVAHDGKDMSDSIFRPLNVFKKKKKIHNTNKAN